MPPRCPDEFILDPWLCLKQKTGGESYFGFRYSHCLWFLQPIWHGFCFCFCYFNRRSLILVVAFLFLQKHAWRWANVLYWIPVTQHFSLWASPPFLAITLSTSFSEDLNQLPSGGTCNTLYLSLPAFQVLRFMGTYLSLIQVQTRVWES